MSHGRRIAWLAWATLATAGAAGAADGPRASQAWARATPPGITVGAAYLAIDGGTRADRLVSVAADRAQRVEFHRVETTDGVVRMRRVDSVELPAGTRVEFAPQGLHLMLIGLAAPLREGEVITLALRYERGAEQSIAAQVRR